MDLKNLGELEKIGLSFIASVLVFRIVFFNESAITLLKAVLAAYWLLILPGIGTTYLFRDLAFIERLAAAIPISAALIGISSYYLGLLGVHIKISMIVLPIIFISISVLNALRHKRSTA